MARDNRASRMDEDRGSTNHAVSEDLDLAQERTAGRAVSILSQALTPRLVISVVFALALLAALLALGNPDRAWRLMTQAGWLTLLAIVVLTVPYLAARALVWRRLLVTEGVELSWAQALGAFAGGEFAKNLPGGIYLEDFLLSRRGAPVSRSLAATTAASGPEVVVAVPVVLGWGVPGWPWLRPTLLVLLLVNALPLVLLWWIVNPTGESVRLPLPGTLQTLLQGLRTLLAAARPLISLRTLQRTLLPTTLALGIVAVDLLLLGHAVGVQGFTLPEAAVVYGVATLVVDLTPVPTDLGVTEASGTGVMLSFGATRPQAVATLLLLRLLLTGATMLLTGLLLLVLWHLRRRQRSAPVLVPPAAAGRQVRCIEPRRCVQPKDVDRERIA